MSLAGRSWPPSPAWWPLSEHASWLGSVPVHEDTPGMESRAHIDFISKLLIKFTAQQKYCIVQLGQVQTALPQARSRGPVKDSG